MSATGTSAIDLTGNALKQEIIGNAGANIPLDGGAGAADTVRGLGGNAGSNILDGKGGNDTLTATGPLAASAFRANTTGGRPHHLRERHRRAPLRRQRHRFGRRRSYRPTTLRRAAILAIPMRTGP